MTLGEYQSRAMATCMGTCDNVPYMLLNLQGEVGEFSSKVAKWIRKGLLHVGTDYYGADTLHPDFDLGKMVEFDHDLQKEAGDILWQLSGLCSVMGWGLEEIAKMNLDKLASRRRRGVIDGDGDNR